MPKEPKYKLDDKVLVQFVPDMVALPATIEGVCWTGEYYDILIVGTEHSIWQVHESYLRGI